MNGQPAAGGHPLFWGDDRLEGILEWPETTEGRGRSEEPAPGAVAGGVVIAHPHPLYGGTMAQPLVYRVAQACLKHGMATLRFNFRGVGRSRGTYSGAEEYRDVEAAAAYLRGELAGSAGDTGPGAHELPVALAGYSFGSVMAAVAAVGEVPVQALALVALVVAWDEMPPQFIERLAAFRGPVLAVCGDRDDLAPPREADRVLRKLKLDFSLSVVQGADHFFEGRQREVGERVAAFLDAAFGGRTTARGDW
ncbi:MAG: alpha/beta family hydrolase [bacterium]